MKSGPVIDQILDLAQSLIQTRGYNAMSYRHLADEIGIKTSSVHYYFPAKEDLGRALIVRYREAFKGALAGIDGQPAIKTAIKDDRSCRVGNILNQPSRKHDATTAIAIIRPELQRPERAGASITAR